MRRLFLLMPILLAACLDGGPAAAPEGRLISVHRGQYDHHDTWRIYESGAVTVESLRPGAGPSSRVLPEAPGAYAAAAAVLAAEGPAVSAAIAGIAACPDYGSMAVRALPPVAGFDQAEVSCPNPAMTRFQAEILRLIGAE